MGFVCQLGKVAIDKISSSALPAILKGKDGSLYLLDQINKTNAKVYEATSGRLKSSRVNLKDLKEWYSGEILIASPAKEDKKALKERLRTLNPCTGIGNQRFTLGCYGSLYFKCFRTFNIFIYHGCI